MAMEANVLIAGLPSGLTQLHIILPAQHFKPQGKQAPEQRLMIAVLRDALDCFEKYRFATGIYGRRLFHEARRWFLADEPQWPYSFERICGVLDLDSNAVRERLRLRSAPSRNRARAALPQR
jgi:hypothetical protein